MSRPSLLAVTPLLLALAPFSMGAGGARAQAPGEGAGTFSAERFRPALDTNGLIDVESGKVLGHLSPDAALWLGYALNPLLIQQSDGGGDPFAPAGALVAHRLGGNLVASIGLFDWVQLGLDVPFILFQADDTAALSGQVKAGAPSAIGSGDLRVVPKFRLLRADEQVVDLAVSLGFTAPTGFPADSYLGDGNFTFVPEAHVSRDLGPATIGANLGLRLRERKEFLDLVVDHEISYRAGIAWHFHETNQLPLTLMGSFNGATPLVAAFQNVNTAPLEVLAGAAYDLGPLQVFGDVGVGVVAGFGTPAARVLAGVRFAPRDGDKDNDGVKDSGDRCPEEPEDQDGFDDVDGCPDPDNDQDTVLDGQDKCPNAAEDLDKHDDEDGCPDPDDDGDGVKDVDDACRDVPEDADDFDDTDGCPDPDNDKDGVKDDDDECRDVKGVVERKGCPIPDKDNDTFPDDTDFCPDVPGTAQFIGCPDTDGDGIGDAEDRCPTEPETVNGINDEDGCPDKGASKVVLTKDKIEILEKVFFDTGKAKIQQRSFNLLNQVASILKAHAEITHMLVEGHTDAQGSEHANLRLSGARANAVVEYLVAQGVDRERLESQGFGESRPLEENNTAKGREANRRVEFSITEIKTSTP
ncbi:MAG: OmpA family protein [Deltaproteobacteria bacterium]|nr:OmpA family protein [Deltaproteobacteria bacterium]